MDWNHQLIDSAIWLLKAYIITAILFCVAVWAVARFTVWGRQFWDISGAYFTSRRNWRPVAVVAVILLLTLGAVRLDVLFSNWYNSMYSSLQKLDEAGFWFAMLVFGILATTHVIRSLIEFYVQQAFTIHWRVWLNERLLSRWLEKRAYFRTQYLDTPVENPDQRIQQDVAGFVQTSLSLSMGLVNALVSTFAFTLILWNLSGPLNLFGVSIPRAMVFLVFVYVIIATYFAIRIGRPLILLNFLNERFNADYRYALVRMREYAESIAFYAGERVEGALLRSRFGQVISNAWAIVYRSLKFLGFNFAISQTAVVFPFILQAQRFFTKQITLGDLIQTAQAFGQLQSNLSFFRNAYDSFAAYRATLSRLTGFSSAIIESYSLPEPDVREEGALIALRDLTITTPAGRVLLERLTLEARANTPLLIRGPSGAGKTTLLRAVAGLWPYCSGDIIRPEHSALFLSQKPYLPLGSLRDALYYPNQVLHDGMATPASEGNLEQDLARAGFTRKTLDRQSHALPEVSFRTADALSSPTATNALVPINDPPPVDTQGKAAEILTRIHLGHLTDRLDEVADWGRILSLGEQQRLAFGRLLLAAPLAAFLDEATSAMDEGLEDAMYRLVRELLPNTILVSVGHRSTLVPHHVRQLILQGEGRWVLQ
ncbi:MAG TPA: ABC transporter ATP-binding protein/permease [Burkholderiaceae bacterium]|nr:ABC transporter ATP-binding protein/permease [Burkholderiaceae bacterium]